MSDISDVQTALVALAAQVLYPNGTSQPSILGSDIKAYAGWPTANTLDTDLASGKCHVTVFALPQERNVTRYSRDWQQQQIGAQTVTLTVAGQTVTVGGAVSVPQNVMLRVDATDYVYSVQQGDTLTGIATALATMIPGASSSGPTVTLPATSNLTAARVGSGGKLVRELRRQERMLQITVWAAKPEDRDTVAKALDFVMAKTDRITMADGVSARVIYRGSPQTDGLQKAALYRRDLHYTVEYATTETTEATQIVANQLNIVPQNNNGAQISTVQVNF